MTDGDRAADVERQLHRLVPWLLAIVGLLVYVNTLPNEFVFDDVPHILRDPSIRSLANLPEIVGSNRRWVSQVTLAINWALDGDEPRGYHLVNTLIHILAAVTLYGLVRRIAGGVWRMADQDAPRPTPHALRATLLASAIALLWLVHPLNTQAVTYVIQRQESLMALFYLLTLYGTVRVAQAQGVTSRRLWAVGTVVACAAGMSSKEVMVTAPVVTLLLDRAFLAGSFAQVLRQRWGLYLGLAATWLSFPLNGLETFTQPDASAGFSLKLVTWWQYLLSQGEIILHYLRLAVWPHPLVIDYLWLPAAIVEDAGYRLLHVWIPCAVVALLLAVSLWGLIRNTWWGFLGGMFFAVLSVTSSVLPIADLAMEHRMYLPLAAVLTLGVIAGDKALRRWVPPNQRPLVASGVVGLIAVVFAGLTVQRNFEYRTPVTLWTTVTQRAPDNPRGFHNLGSSLDDEGRLDEAMVAYSEALRRVPTHADAHHNLGKIWLDRGEPQRALPHIEQAVESNPADANNWVALGNVMLALDRLDEAEAAQREAIQRDPENPAAHNNLGIILARQGQHEDAIAAFRRALELDPDRLDAYRNLANELVRLGRLGEAADVAGRSVEVARRLGVDPVVIRQMEAGARQLADLAAQADPAPAAP